MDEQRASVPDEVEVEVRRAPKYGAFMGLGAVLGAVAAWILASVQPPAVDANDVPVDTTPVIGLFVVVGFVVGAVLGGIVAIIADRRSRRTATRLRAEHEVVAVAHDDAPEDAGEAAFEPIEPPADRRED